LQHGCISKISDCRWMREIKFDCEFIWWRLNSELVWPLQTIEAWSQINNISSKKLLEKNHFIPEPSQEVPDMVIYTLNRTVTY